MDNIKEQRSVIESFHKTVDQSSFVLKENPELVFPQVYNRLQWQTKEKEFLKRKLDFERKRFKKPWLPLLTRPAQSSALIRTLTGHSAIVQACTFSPDGSRIVSGSWDSTLKLWDVESGEEISSLRGHAGDVLACAFSPDGSRIVLGDNVGQILIVYMENIELFPAIVTPHIQSGELLYRCQYCQEKNQIDESLLGQEINCSSCSETVKLNPFTVKLD